MAAPMCRVKGITKTEERVVRKIKIRLLSGPETVDDLRCILTGSKESRIFKKLGVFLERHTELFWYDAVTQKLGLLDLGCPGSSSSTGVQDYNTIIKSERVPHNDPGVRCLTEFSPSCISSRPLESCQVNSQPSCDAEELELRVVQRLQARMQDGRSMSVSALRCFLGNLRIGGSAEDLRAVTDWAVFASRHPDIFRWDAASTMPHLTLCATTHEAIPGKEGTAAEAQAIILEADAEMQHTIKGSGAGTHQPKQKISKKGINPQAQAEARVVWRLMSLLQSGPATISDLRDFLDIIQGGGGPDDLWVVADVEAFAVRHMDIFLYDAAINSFSLRSTSLSVIAPQDKGAHMKLRPHTKIYRGSHPKVQKGTTTVVRKIRPMQVAKAIKILTARPEIPCQAVESAATVSSGLSIHTLATVDSDAPAGTDGIPTLAEDDTKAAVIMRAAAEARMVQNMKLMLLRGPVKASAVLKFMRNPKRGNCQSDIHVLGDFPAFIVKHSDVFWYDARAKTVSLRFPESGSCPSVMEGAEEAEHRVVHLLKGKLWSGPLPMLAVLQTVVTRFGKNSEEVSVVADLPAFAHRHNDVFYCHSQQAVPLLSLRRSGKGTWLTDPYVIQLEDALVQRLQTQLKERPMNTNDLTAFVARTAVDSAEISLAADWSTFVWRYQDVFFYNGRQSVPVVGMRRPAYQEASNRLWRTKKK